MHEQTIEECDEAWRSHATLDRQAEATFRDVVAAIETYLHSIGEPSIQIPYSTNIGLVQSR